MKILTTVLFAILMTLAAFAAPTVTDVVAKQRYPWNGLVDITCKVSGIDGTSGELELVFVASAIMPNSGFVKKLASFWVVKDGKKLTDRVDSANGNYQLVWDAKADLGVVRYTNMVVVVHVIVDRKKVRLWEGGPYWATTNIGAGKTEDYGYYFWWGDAIGYKRENDKWVASDGSDANFSFGLKKTCNKTVGQLQREGWVATDGVLAPEHDAAHLHWGGDWRMPTMQEIDDLNNKCDWTWTTMNGVNGYVVRGRGEYASNSIFLPCAGSGGGTSLFDLGLLGTYWSSEPVSHNADMFGAVILGFRSDSRWLYAWSCRGNGRSVRPVQGFTR